MLLTRHGLRKDNAVHLQPLNVYIKIREQRVATVGDRAKRGQARNVQLLGRQGMDCNTAAKIR